MERLQRHWTLSVDGAARGNPGPAAAGIVLSVNGQVIVEEGVLLGHATNNVAEYRALILGLTKARDMGVRHLRVLMDSELVVKQVLGLWRVRNANLRSLWSEARALMAAFDEVKLELVPRRSNRRADLLANRALDHAT